MTLDTKNGGENSTLVAQVVDDWTAMRVNALPNMNEYLLRRLDDNSTYQLQVLAKNPIGYSDPETFLFRTPPGAFFPISVPKWNRPTRAVASIDASTRLLLYHHRFSYVCSAHGLPRPILVMQLATHNLPLPVAVLALLSLAAFLFAR